MITFNSMLSTLQDGTSWTLALHLLDQMQLSRLEPATWLKPHQVQGNVQTLVVLRWKQESVAFQFLITN